MWIDRSLTSILCLLVQQWGYTLLGPQCKKIQEGKYQSHLKFQCDSNNFVIYGSLMEFPFEATASALIYALNHFDVIFGVKILDIKYACNSI